MADYNFEDSIDTAESDMSDLNIGSENALESAPQFGLSGAQSSAVPAPPPGYNPSSLAPVSMETSDNAFMKFANGFVYGVTGQVPLSMKLKLAEQSAKLAESKDRLGWANFYKNQELANAQLHKHEREAMLDFLKVLPNIKAQISSVTEPEEQKKLSDHWAKSAEAMAPGGGRMVKFFQENQASVYSSDAMLSDPDPSISEPALKLVQSMGYDNAVMSAPWIELSHIQNRDRVNAVASRMPIDARKKMADGSLDENEFRALFKQTLIETGQRPVVMAAAQTFLDTPQGQAQMFGMGVRTNALSIELAKKQKDGGLAGQLKEADLKNTKSILDFNTAHPGLLPAKVVTEATLRMDRHLGLAAKESSPGQFSENNSLSPFLIAASGNKFNNPDTMFDGVAPGSAEEAKRLRILDSALAKRAEAAPLGSNVAKLDMPHDFSEKPVFTMTDKGELKRVEGPMTQKEYLSGKGTFSMSPDQRTKLSELTQTAENGRALFKEAAKAYKATDVKGRAAELLAENATSGWLQKVPGASAVAATTHPDLFNYVSRRDSALGKFARSLGGEVGVLTDQDIARVVKMFANASDSQTTRKAKERAFNQLVDLNRKALFTTLASKRGSDSDGDVTPEEIAQLKKENQAAVNGILGSVEDLSRKDAAEVKQYLRGSSVPSLAEPASPEQGSRAETLLEKMRKGK